MGQKYGITLLYIRRGRHRLEVEAETPIQASQVGLEEAIHLGVRPLAALVHMPDKTMLAFRFKKSGAVACPYSEVQEFDVETVRRR